MSTFFQLTDLGLAASPTAFMNQWLAYMQTVFPGYTPQAGNLEYIQALVFAAWASDVATQASQGSNALFRAFGQKLIGVQPLLGSSSGAVITLVAFDDVGHTLPAGTQFLLDRTFGFQSLVDVVLAPGTTTANAGIFSALPGSVTNGAGTQGVAINQEIDWVKDVTLLTIASGGQDGETDDQYQSRLAGTLTLMAPRPITAADYALFSLGFQPETGTDQQEVGRATSIDGYDPAPPVEAGWSPFAGGTGTLLNEREVTVCVADANGIALNSDTLAAVQAWLATHREVNFIVNVVSPTYVPVYISASVVASPNFTASAVQANISTTLQALLSPGTWPGTGAAWTNTPIVPVSVIESAIQSTVGVQSIVTGTLGMGFGPAPQGANDLDLGGPFPLPTTSGGTTVPPEAFTVVN